MHSFGKNFKIPLKYHLKYRKMSNDRSISLFILCSFNVVLPALIYFSSLLYVAEDKFSFQLFTCFYESFFFLLYDMEIMLEKNEKNSVERPT